jgi:hypothetical protein
MGGNRTLRGIAKKCRLVHARGRGLDHWMCESFSLFHRIYWYSPGKEPRSAGFCAGARQ